MVHEVYAIIKEETIKNIAVYANYEKANQLARMVYGNNAFAVRCDYYQVSEGDKYKDGTFYYNDGVTQVQRAVTTETRCEQLTSDVGYISLMTGIMLE